MTEAARLRQRADRCREIARDYRDDVGAPLYDMARGFEARASEIERQGINRRLETAASR